MVRFENGLASFEAEKSEAVLVVLDKASSQKQRGDKYSSVGFAWKGELKIGFINFALDSFLKR